MPPFKWDSLYPDSNALAILLSVYIVWWLYKREQKDKIKNAARILLEEIRQADSALELIKSSSVVHQLTFIMPNTSWSELKYLFIKKLSDDDLKVITDYYAACSVVEKILNDMKDVTPRAIKAKSSYIQRALVELATKHANDENENEYKLERGKFMQIVLNEETIFEPQTPSVWLKTVVEKIPKFIGNTVFEKLKKIGDLN